MGQREARRRRARVKTPASIPRPRSNTAVPSPIAPSAARLSDTTSGGLVHAPDSRHPIGGAAEIDVLLSRAGDLQVRDGSADRRHDGVMDLNGERLDPVGRPARVQMYRQRARCTAGRRVGDELLKRHEAVGVIVAAVVAVARTGPCRQTTLSTSRRERDSAPSRPDARAGGRCAERPVLRRGRVRIVSWLVS